MPTVSLHVHERIIQDNHQSRTVQRENADARRARGRSGNVAVRGSRAEPATRDALDFYRHPHGWTNRFIAGDSCW